MELIFGSAPSRCWPNCCFAATQEPSTLPLHSPTQNRLGRLAQRESAAFTRQRSLVRSQYRPPIIQPMNSGFSQPRKAIPEVALCVQGPPGHTRWLENETASSGGKKDAIQHHNHHPFGSMHRERVALVKSSYRILMVTRGHGYTRLPGTRLPRTSLCGLAAGRVEVLWCRVATATDNGSKLIMEGPHVPRNDRNSYCRSTRR